MEEIHVVTAVHHPTRRRIIDHLVLHAPAQVGAMARALDLQVGSVSHHLRVLQKVGAVEQVPDPDGDGRRSWWRMARSSFRWSADDFTSPGERLQAREAERANLGHQLTVLQRWQERKHAGEDPAWVQTSFSNDGLGWATPEELQDLADRLIEAGSQWRDSIDREDGQERRPVFWFTHGFPVEP